MADLRITELDDAGALAGNEQVEAVQAGANVKYTPAQVRTYLLATGLDTIALRDAALNAAVTALLDGVPTDGDTLKKLHDLILALESTKLDASAYNEYFKGRFTSEAALFAEYTPAELKPGDYAQVNEPGAEVVKNYSWDDEDEVWVEGGSGSGAANTDELPEGSTNLYFTAARVLATILTGFTPGAGTVAATDTLLQALQKIVGNIALKQDALGFTPENVANKAIGTGALANSDTTYPSEGKVLANIATPTVGSVLFLYYNFY